MQFANQSELLLHLIIAYMFELNIDIPPTNKILPMFSFLVIQLILLFNYYWLICPLSQDNNCLLHEYSLVIYKLPVFFTYS